MTEIYLTISLSTHNGDDTLQNYIYSFHFLLRKVPISFIVSVIINFKWFQKILAGNLM